MSTTLEPAEGLVAVLDASGLLPLLGLDSDCPVVLQRKKARLLGSDEPFKLLTPEQAETFDLASWQRAARAALDDRAATNARMKLRADIEAELREHLVTSERVPPGLAREIVRRRAALQDLAAAGVCRVTRYAGVWRLSVPEGDFTPEGTDGARLWLCGSSLVPDGEPVLLGWRGNEVPVVLIPARLGDPARAVAITDGVWQRPAAGGVSAWLEHTRESIAKAARPTAAEQRAELLERLRVERAVTPAEGNEAELLILQMLEAEGWCRGLGGVFVLARTA